VPEFTHRSGGGSSTQGTTKAPDAPAPGKHTLTEQLIPHALVPRSPAQPAPGTKGAHGGNRAAPYSHHGPLVRDALVLREIHEVRALVKAKQDRVGRPVDTVRVLFAEEWMARRERRPLLDVGARVFFMDPKTGSDVEIKD
jgi:hypothetical protein